MAAPFKLKGREEAGGDPAQALRVTEDDFSVQVAQPSDPIFWVRVERGPSKTIVVTDFNPGARPATDLEVALLMAVRAVHKGHVERLVFRDLIPNGGEQEGLPVRLHRSAELAKRLASSVAAGLGGTVESFQIEPRRGKLDAVVGLNCDV